MKKIKIILFLTTLTLFIPNLSYAVSLDFDAMVILGSHIRNTAQKRIDGAYKLIKAGDFDKIIISGGCVVKEVGDIGLICPYDCSTDCTESSEMKKMLIAKDSNLEEKIILEEASRSTSSNYRNTKKLLSSEKKNISSFNCYTCKIC